MESPFYGNYWSQPAHPRYTSNLRGVPVQPIHQNATTIKPASRVVQIPVHFVGSDSNRIRKPKPDLFSSALKIQKVFRGFLVRKYVKKIVSIKKEVDEIERKLLCSETAELIRKNEKERLRVNETLMSLLLKLDSVRGIDSGVRDFRKTVIKKAISLQEKIDSIVSAGVQVSTDDVAPENDEKMQLECDDDVAPENEEKSQPAGEDDVAAENNEETQLEGDDDVAQVNDEKKQLAGEDDVAPEDDDEKTQLLGEDDVAPEDDEKTQLQGEDDVAPANGEEKQLQGEEDDVAPEDDEKKPQLEGEDDVAEEVHCAMDECGEGIDEEREDDDKKRNRELLEKMVEENEKMMRMMNELCKRNEVQTRMLNSLTQRVEQLEKAFICDRLKPKKKKRHPA